MTTVIPIKGDIVTNNYGWFYDLFGDDYASPQSVADAITAANGDDLQIEISSPGGLVDAGSEIYTMLRAYAAPVTVNVVAAAYSAASIIAMAGDTVQMSPVAMMMIHNVSGGASGDYHDLANASEMLKKSNTALANAYMQKTGKSQEEILALMDSTYWLDPQSAVDQGFADKLMFEDTGPEAMNMTASLHHLPSEETMNKFKQFRQPPRNSEAAILDPALVKAQLTLLNLKGEIL